MCVCVCAVVFVGKNTVPEVIVEVGGGEAIRPRSAKVVDRMLRLAVGVTVILWAP